VKFRIRKRPTVWMAFDAPNPRPWRLDIPAGLKIANQPLSDLSDHRTFEDAVKALAYLLKMKKKGWLHR
jgi:hypothetical protein